MSAEHDRLAEDAARSADWKRWGPYLAEREWATVREDYSANADAWDSFPHDMARSRAYRWGEDGLLGFCDRQCRLCFAVALWNGRDPILKERLFGLTGHEGNHGEDVKESYFYIEATPTYSYAKALYRYPQAEFPYERLIEENRRRTRNDPEFELIDTGVMVGNRFFDICAEYAKNTPDDIAIRLTISNPGPDTATLHLLPTAWFRNTWSWGATDEELGMRPLGTWQPEGRLSFEHATLGHFLLDYGPGPGGQAPDVLFTENETNTRRLWGTEPARPFVKDAFDEYVVHGNTGAVNPAKTGTKAALYYVLTLQPGASEVIRLRLHTGAEMVPDPLGASFDAVFAARMAEAETFHHDVAPNLTPAEFNVVQQAYAGLLWSKQFYYFVVDEWLHGDPASPPPPPSHAKGRNHTWGHLHGRDVLSMPDKWEYPWLACWDLAFHVIPLARIDPDYAKHQVLLLLREWYMHPNGQLPAYEYNFCDVNPPVHAWAAWRVYKIAACQGARDRDFLERVFQKLLLNFTWWVNRKDANGENLFSGGFLGLDNIGVFDRSKPLPGGGTLRQADATGWMAFYCGTMLSIALELAQGDGTHIESAYEDMASKFFEHFVQISDAMNGLGGTGLWDDEDGFYYDQAQINAREVVSLRTRSIVGLLPLIAVEVLDGPMIRKLPGFFSRLKWFVKHRADLAAHITYCDVMGERLLLAIPTRDRLQKVLRYMLGEAEFLSPHGIRSLSRYHREHPYHFQAFPGGEYVIDYEPAESRSGIFGGNSNWRGPVWIPINYLLIEALERYHHFYGDHLKVECPTGSGRQVNLQEVALELETRLARLFLPDANGRRPCHGEGKDGCFAINPLWRDLVLFHEYFNGDNGQGLGASHQTGWTALAAGCINDVARRRTQIAGGECG